MNLISGDSNPEHILDHYPQEMHGCIADVINRFDGLKQRILIETLHLLADDQMAADLKMTSKVIQEIHAGLEVFKPYQSCRKVSFFGSARIREDDPRYIQARDCARAMMEESYMIITGGGGGIMQAANEGAGTEHSFGININLPMEQAPNRFVADSPRHFYCQYFFTRKLFFLKESDAVVLAAGGFGTLDEAFETLTLMQTGRNPPIPVVLLEAPGDDYWGPLINSWVRRLVNDGLVNQEDDKLLYHTDSIQSAVAHIRNFYSNYHSFRYVGEWVLLRINDALNEDALARLNAEFSDVLHEGQIEQITGWPKSDDPQFAHLPRLRMKLDQRRMTVLPQIIRRMNSLYARDKNNRNNESGNKS